MEKNNLSTVEVAKYCQVTYRSVLKWIETGKIKAQKVSARKYVILIDDFLEFLADNNMSIPEDLRRYKTKKRVLLVDDDKDMVDILKSFFSSTDYDVSVAFNGFDAGRKISSFEPDVIILDLRMPGMEGGELLRYVKYSRETSHIKVIIISAYLTQEEIERISLEGADACIEKPFTPETLLKTVKNIV